MPRSHHHQSKFDVLPTSFSTPFAIFRTRDTPHKRHFPRIDRTDRRARTAGALVRCLRAQGEEVHADQRRSLQQSTDQKALNWLPERLKDHGIKQTDCFRSRPPAKTAAYFPGTQARDPAASDDLEGEYGRPRVRAGRLCPSGYVMYSTIPGRDWQVW